MKPLAPDGGWGWMVVLAYFLISVITDGIRYSFGVMLISLVEAFGKGSGETAWVGGLMAGTCNLSDAGSRYLPANLNNLTTRDGKQNKPRGTIYAGPIVTKLADKYGCRLIAIAGSLIASLGFFASVFAPSLYMLYISFGIVSGFGFGMIFLTSIVTVSRYFDKRRSLAMGISVCGSGVGAIIFNPLIKILLDEYGWRGTILIQAGLMLNCVALALLYRPLPHSVQESSDAQNEEKDIGSLEEKEALSRSIGHHSEYDTGVKYHNCENGIHLKEINRDIINKSNKYLNYELEVYASNHTAVRNDSEEPKCEENELSSFMHNNKELVNSYDDVISYKSTSERKSICEQCGIFSREMFRFSLLKDTSFLIFMLSSFLISVGYNVPYIYLPDLTVKLGYSRSQGALLISYLGFANTVSRILSGALGDRPQVNRTYMYIVLNIICGLFSTLVPLYSSYGLLIMYAVVFGTTIGGYVSLSTLVIGDLFGIEIITESVGLYMLICGVASIVGAPAAGWLYDITRSYAVSFISIGVLITLGGALLFIIPCLKRFKGKKGAV